MSTKIARSIGSVSIATLFSRILGYLRDMVVASSFGNGPVADTFYLAFRIPNLLRDLLGEGSLSSGFIPVFTECYVQKGKEEASALYSACLGLMLVVLSAVTLLGIIFAPVIVRLIAWGWWDKPEQLELAVKLTRIMFPFIAFISLSALAMGVLNSLHSFFVPAVAPVMVSIFEIAAVFLLVPVMHVPIEGLAWGVLCGGLFQFLWQVPALMKNGFLHKLVLKMTPEIRKIGVLIIPVAIGSGVRQINVLVDQVCASFLGDGSIMALYYANRLYQLPLALFGLSIATVALPVMSRAAANQNIPDLKKTLSLSLRMMLLAMVPSTVGLVVLGEPIIRLLFQHGNFNSAGTGLTNLALLYFSLGLVFFAGARIVAAAFYSMQDTRTPVKIAIIAMITNAVLNVILMRFLQVGGLALATTLASGLNMLLLLQLLRKRLGLLGARQMVRTGLKVVLASLVMGLACFLLRQWVIAALAAGAAVFIMMVHLLKVEEFKYLKNIVLRRQISEL
jgi:putative peptidoglycan lipid II flippase